MAKRGTIAGDRLLTGKACRSLSFIPRSVPGLKRITDRAVESLLKAAVDRS